MGECVGLDFGTTYSTIAYIKKTGTQASENMVRDIRHFPPGRADGSEDSIVAIDTRHGLTHFGASARDKMGKKGVEIFRGFKMMLAEENEEMRTKWGYVGNYTPREITKRYLADLIKRYIEKDGPHANVAIDKIVCGVPEIWISKNATFNGTLELRKILEECAGDNTRVEIYSEPTCACSYFTHNYQLNKGHPFEGKILVIDYGGGTLDLTLCNISKNENGKPKIDPELPFGSGQNSASGGLIGNAGFAFLEEVAYLALESVGVKRKEVERRKNADEGFNEFVREIEDALVTGSTTHGPAGEMNLKQIEEYLDRISGTCVSIPNLVEDVMNDPEANNFLLREFYYQGMDEPCRVSVKTLVKAYYNVIYPVFNQKLYQMISQLNGNPITGDDRQDPRSCPDAGDICCGAGSSYSVDCGETFKIAPVGGFSNFYLTRKQIQYAFGLADYDKRYEDILFFDTQAEGARVAIDRPNLRLAVAYGAALIANGDTSVVDKARFWLGISGGDPKTHKVEGEAYFAIKMGETLTAEPKYIMFNETERRVFDGDKIRMIVTNTTRNCDPARTEPLILLKRFEEMLGLLKEKYDKYYNMSEKEYGATIAFAMDPRTLKISLFFDIFERVSAPGKRYEWKMITETPIVREMDTIRNMQQGPKSLGGVKVDA